MSQKIDLTTAPRADGTLYPPPFESRVGRDGGSSSVTLLD